MKKIYMLLAVLLFTASAMAQNSVLFYVNDGSMDVQVSSPK